LLCDDRGADDRSLLVVVDRLSAMADVPETRFTRVGQDRVAFQVFGREFDDRGEHVLKGVPGTWKLFAVHI
jgi:hypothetical protein